MQYVENLGGKGILVQIGGNQKGPDDTDNSSMNNLVSHIYLHSDHLLPQRA